MKEHLQELKLGGRPKRKWEIELEGKDKEIEFAHICLTQMEKEVERLNNKEEQLIRRLEDLIIVGEQVENEWAVDICKMIIKELKGEDKE